MLNIALNKLKYNIENAMVRKKLIKVTFPDGTVICLSSRTETMLSVLKKIEEDKLSLIKIKWKHLPLVSVNQYLKFGEWMKPICPGWYLKTKSTPIDKYQQLIEIDSQLQLGLKIEFDYGFDAQDTVVKKPFSTGNLLVKMPDGEYIGNESSIDTFIEAIWKLGVDDIMRKGLTLNDRQLITKNKMYDNQVQIDTDCWVVVPMYNKEKLKLLRVIGAMLHKKIEASLI